ncbi:MAG: mechanosensitive ion channel domain-containing protein [Candidatus Acidiferrales bacterium]|jgi:small-conductance mechanosensitive channel
MKMSLESVIIILASAVVAGLVGWGFLHEPQSTSLFGMLNGGVRHFLQWPFFTIGKVPVTPLFLLKCAVFLIALSVFSRLFRSFLAKRVLGHTSMDRGQQYAFVRAAGYVIFLLGMVIGLDTTGLNLRSLLVVGGALGVGIGFGLQNIVANFVAGIVILWEGPIKLGDFIDVGNTHGEVIRIGARGTWVRTFDNEVIIVPNSEFINTRVANWTANDPTVRISIPLGVSYDSDLDAVRELLLEIAKRNKHVLPEPEALVMVTGFGDNSVNINLRVSTTTTTDRAGMRRNDVGLLKSDLYMEIFRVFREKKIEMPFPQQDVHVRSIDASLVIANPPGKPSETAGAGEHAA